MSATSAPATATTSTPRRSLRWRVVDIIVATVLAVACGLIFVFWNSVGYAWYMAMDALTPGLGGLATGIWLIGGVLGALIIRKSGAAVYVEVLAASVSAVMGSQWGWSTIYSGLAQGIGIELVLIVFAYRKFGLGIAMLGGALAGVGAWCLELFTSGNLAKGPEFLIIYLVCLIISGTILAGVVGHLLTRALAATGALDRFAVGREARAK